MEQDFIEVKNYRNRIAAELEAFKEQYCVSHVLGILGGSENIGEEYAIQVINQCLQSMKGTGIAVLTGGTKGGIPEIGLSIAKENEFPTIAVYPPRAIKYGISDFADLQIMSLPPAIGKSSFGSETYSLTSCLDAAIVIGGSYGTLVEAATILKCNKSRLRKGEKPIYLCPVTGTGGVADSLRNLVNSDSLSHSCLPTYEISDGNQAANYFRTVF